MSKDRLREYYRELEAKSEGQWLLLRVMIAVMVLAMIGLVLGYRPSGSSLPNWWSPALWLLLAIAFRVLCRSAWAKRASRGYRLIYALAMISNVCLVAAVVSFIW
jgi:hypothetical protein